MKSLTSAFELSIVALSLGSASTAQRPGVEHNVAKFLQSLEGGQTLDSMSPTDARAALAAAQAASNVALPAAEVSEKTIRVNDSDLKLTIVRPAGREQKNLPAFMYFHGGGWVLGDFPTHERLVRHLVAGSGAVAVFVNYSLSPEAGYGIAIEQAYAATQWVAEHGQEINVDGKRLAVAGNSAGGNLAAAVALIANAKGSPALRSQLLLCPVTDANFDTPSYKEFANGYFLTKDLMAWFWDHYTSDAEARKQIYASPLQATPEQLKGLPPTLIQTAEFDVLRDEAEAYGRNLDAAGVQVKSVRYNGMIHDFGLSNAFNHLPAVQSAIAQASQELKTNLSQ
ncbi:MULTISPECIES: alpha/beta hydrolase [Pseudomonas syringae group]|uniref:Alpha/beta hydrolase fold domain-containing protein n=2 Tax=Pseudomonas syringae group TaxID=136849 RepID=A0ABX6HCR1_9PSED|nr:alpha/beta hydrolase [Pseudomonas asturiensis]QHF03178.1 alpha/beta hydrolase fold domain-containing protein [Pseudomonas asturiensis]